MKYTKSKDGVERANVRAVVRLERSEVAAIRKRAKMEGRSMAEYLRDCLYCGIRADAAQPGGGRRIPN